MLEARDRIGGRIDTDDSLGFTCDFGASWIHGDKGSPMKKLADRFKVPLMKFDYENIACIEDGKPIDFVKLWKKFDKFEGIIDKYASKAGVDTRMGDMIARIADDNNYDAYARKMLQLYALVEFESEYANKLYILSGSTFSDSEGNDGNDWLIPGGYIQLLKPVAEGMPIELGKPIKRIDQESMADKVVVTTQADEKYYGDYVICTLPLGVLKSGVVDFVPPLQNSKTRSIHKLGFGSLDKIVLVFEKSFWPDVNCFIIWQSQDLNKAFFAVNLNRVSGSSALMVFLPQSKIEQYTNEDSAVQFALDILKSGFPNAEIKLVNQKVTDWRKEQYTRGAYSSLSVGCELTEIKNFTEPEGRIYFALESTHIKQTHQLFVEPGPAVSLERKRS